MVNFNLRITQLVSKLWERVVYASEAKKSEFLVHLDHFSKFLKYFKYFEKWSKCTKNSDFFADSLLNPQIKIGVHLINVELTQLLTLVERRDFISKQPILTS